MQVELSLEDQTFKQEVRAFLAKNLTRDLSERITVGAAASRNVKPELNCNRYVAPGGTRRSAMFRTTRSTTSSTAC